MAKVLQKLKVRVRKGGDGGTLKPCGTCNGTGVVKK